MGKIKRIRSFYQNFLISAVVLAISTTLMVVVGFLMGTAFESYSTRNNAREVIEGYDALMQDLLAQAERMQVMTEQEFDVVAIVADNTLTISNNSYNVTNTNYLASLEDNVVRVVRLSDVSDIPTNDTYLALCKRSGNKLSLMCVNVEVVNSFAEQLHYDGVVVCANTMSARILYSTAYYQDKLSVYLDIEELYVYDNLKDTNEVSLSSNIFDNATMLMAVAEVPQVGAIIGIYRDLTEFYLWRNSTSDMLLLSYIMLCVLLLVAVTVGNQLSYRVGGKTGGAKYIIEVDPNGIIISRNKAFAVDFAEIRHLKEKVLYYSDKMQSVITIADGTDTYKLACNVSHKPNGATMVYGNIIQSPYLEQESAQTDNGMLNCYNRAMEKTKRAVVGTIKLTNIANLETMFGAEFASRLYTVLLDKAQNKFSHVWTVGKYDIGIVVEDTKEIDLISTDMADIINYLNRPVKLYRNTVMVGVVGAFAICDYAMTDRSFEYAMDAVDATHKRIADSDGFAYYIYHESQKKLYEKYFIKFDIENMLANDSFELQYQPQVSLVTGKIVGFEALFRVKNTLYNVSVFDIIQYAERTGNMIALGEFIFDNGMAFAKSLEPSGVTVSLNVSPIQLMQAGFVENLLSIYNRYSLKPGSVCLEITESFLMTTFDETLQKLQILKKNGINIHLDDFGTQYSSLQYLQKLPISSIKIDRTFVTDVATNKVSGSIIGMVVTLCRQLKLECIAEGVETQEQRQILGNIGCDIIQGYLVGKAMMADKAKELLDKQR